MNALITEKFRNWKIDHSKQISPQILRILRERIIYCDLEPGAAISEPAIATAYGVSRQPVRETFIKLANEGLLDIRPQRKTLVRKISYIAVMDARFVREAVEADIVKLLAEKRDSSLITELRRQLQKQNDEAGSPINFIRLDERFHRTLAEAAGKCQAWRYIEELKVQMDRVRILRLKQFPVERLIQQHRRVVDAIEAGNIEHSETAIRNHLREILQVLPDIYEANTKFFDGPDIITPFKHTSLKEEIA